MRLGSERNTATQFHGDPFSLEIVEALRVMNSLES